MRSRCPDATGQGGDAVPGGHGRSQMDFGVIAVGHAIYVSASLGRPLRSGSVRFLTGAKTVSGMNRSSGRAVPGLGNL